MSIKIILYAHIKRMNSIEIAKCLQQQKETLCLLWFIIILLSYLNEIQQRLMTCQKRKKNVPRII